MAKTSVVLFVLTTFLASMLAVQGTPPILDYRVIQRAKKGFELGKSVFLQGSANVAGTGEVGSLSKGMDSASANSPTAALNVLGKILAKLDNGSVSQKVDLGAIAKDLGEVTNTLTKIAQAYADEKRGPSLEEIRAFISKIVKLERDFYGRKQA